MDLNAAEYASRSKAPEAVAILQWLLILGNLYHIPYTSTALIVVYASLVSLGCLLVVLLCFVTRPPPVRKKTLQSKVFHLSTLLQLLIFSTAGDTTLVALLLAIETIGVIVVWQTGE